MAGAQPLSLLPPSTVVLIDGGVPVEAPKNIIYSTGPLAAHGDDGNEYVIKAAGDAGSIAAEAVGYRLAELVGVRTPPFAIGTDVHGRPVFASRKLTTVMRDCGPWVARARDAIAAVLVLDAWLFNNDRNIGGLMVEPVGGGAVEIVAIDFEQSWAVRKERPLVETALIEPKSLWPRGVLGTMLRGTAFPAAAIAACRRISDEAVVAVTDSVHQVVPGFTWHAAAADALRWRRDYLEKIIREVWQ